MIVRPTQARPCKYGLLDGQILVDGERSGGAWWLGRFCEYRGFMTPLHLHPEADEYFYVLDGVLSVFLDGQWHDLEAGSVAQIPRGTSHAQGVTGSESTNFLGWGAPAGFDGAFRELSELALRMSHTDPQWGAEVSRIITRHDTKVLGPPPRRA